MYLNPAVPVKTTDPHISTSTGDTENSEKIQSQGIKLKALPYKTHSVLVAQKIFKYSILKWTILSRDSKHSFNEEKFPSSGVMSCEFKSSSGKGRNRNTSPRSEMSGLRHEFKYLTFSKCMIISWCILRAFWSI